MKPILFDKDATQFNTNGIGRLEPVECFVIEERNGQYELEMSISQDSQYASEIGMESIIVVKPNDADPLQAFRVYQITKPIGGIFDVYAQHIRYQLNMIPTKPFSVTASADACTQVLAGLKNNAVSPCPFTFHTDVHTISSYNQKLPAAIGVMMGGTAGSVIDQFGGEWKYDNYDVYLYAHRGIQTPLVTFRYGKDITDLTQEEAISNTITGIMPYWTNSEGTEIVTIDEEVVESPYTSNYTYPRIITKDFSSDFQEKPTKAQLKAHAEAYINRAGIGIPAVNIKVSFVELSKTLEYEELLQYQTVSLCDIVGISFVNLGIETTAKVVKTVYNVLKERYDSIEIGATRNTLASNLNDINTSIASLADATTNNFGKMSNELQELIDEQTAWLTSTDSVVRGLRNAQGDWTDILLCETIATENTGRVIRLNSAGIGFSRTGWNPSHFQQAWTIDGRLVIGGTNVPSITVYDAYNNIIFQASADAMIWNATNSSMDANGIITAQSAQLTNAEIIGGAITMIGTNSWLYLADGEIFGGRGTTVGQNQTSISFDSVIDNRSGNITLTEEVLAIDANKIGVRRQKGSGTYWLGNNGNYVVGFSEEDINIDYVDDIDVDWEFINIDFISDIEDIGGGAIRWHYGSASFYNAYNINPSTSHTSWHNLYDYTTREVINGIAT